MIFIKLDMAHGKYKHPAERTQPDNVLRNKAFKNASNPKYDRYQRGLASMAYMFFDKKYNGSGVNFMPNQPQLAN